MRRVSTIDGYFKKKTPDPDCPISGVNIVGETSIPTSTATDSIPIENPPTKYRKIEVGEFDVSLLERDPGLRKQICDYDVNQRDEIRRAYIKLGPHQPLLSKYPKSGKENHRRSFQPAWFKAFPSWLEYSVEKDAAFCLPCFLFNKSSRSSLYHGQIAFTIEGFNSWKKAMNGTRGAFLSHVGKDPNSFHKIAQRSCEDLMNQSQHIQKVLDNFNSEQIADNRLRLKASVETVRLLAHQGIAFRGLDESESSMNRGNFLQMLYFGVSFSEKLIELIRKAPKHASYTSPQSQKEILHVFSTRVKKEIREEIGDGKFCLIVDEARDESMKEQMAIVVRFVDKDGFVRERFFGVVHVPDTTSLTLKNEIYSILSHHSLDIQNIRGQGYDGASNMRGGWNGLQALVSNDCPYAYYIHYFAHRLQLALVAASKEVGSVYCFFKKLPSIVNIVSASCKRYEELRLAQVTEIEHLISTNELQTGKGLNQIRTVQRPADTRWSSHLRSICSLIKLFSATCVVLLKIKVEGNSSQRGEAESAYEVMTTFEFVFMLHLMKEIMLITDALCQALQRKTQDILNAMNLVSSTKKLLQNFRDDGWDALHANVRVFCEARNIDVPDMNARYIERGGRARHQQDDFTIEHHYRVDFFCAAIDSQLQELNRRFSEHAMDLLSLASALDPRDAHAFFRIDDICRLVENYYPKDFTDHEKILLRIELNHFEHNVVRHPDFKKLENISKLCRWLVETRRSITYLLVYRVLVLVLTLPVSTATTERAFSAMNIVKTRLRNKMEDEFLTDALVLFIEKEISSKISSDSIMDDFRDLKERRILL